MRKWMAAAAAAGTMTLAGFGHGAELEIEQCSFPEPPVVPDGATATEAEMGQAGAEVREFVAGIQSSLECLSEAEKSLGEEITQEQQAQLVTVYNSGVDQMNAVANNYNEQVKAYKAR